MNSSFVDQSADPSVANSFQGEPRESRGQPVEHVLPHEETLAFLAAMKRAESFGEYCEIRNRILVGHLSVIRNLVRSMVGKPALWDDLESEGVRELIRAIDRYDSKRGSSFRGYAAACIRNRILNELMAGDGFGIAGNTARNLHSLRAMAVSGDLQTSRPGEETKIPSRAIRRLAPFVHMVSLNSPARGTSDMEGADTAVGEVARVDPVLADEPASAPESLQMNEDLAILGKTLRRLPWKERFIIERLYGLDGHPPRTQSEVAWLFGISRQRVSQIQAATLSRLKESGWGQE